MTREPVIFMQFEAMPSEAIAERDNVSGAHVDCWIQARDPEQAEARGRHWIAKEGWVVVGVKQWRPVDVDAETMGPDAEVHPRGDARRRLDRLSSVVPCLRSSR